MGGIDAMAALQAIDQIKRLKARFFIAVDDKDWATYATLFTPDARFDVGAAFEADQGAAAVAGFEGTTAVSGGAAMAEMVKRLLDGVATVHIGYMPVIDLVSEVEAKSTWPVEDWLWLADGSEPTVRHGFGRYTERYVKTDGGWLIASLGYARLRWAPTAG